MAHTDIKEDVRGLHGCSTGRVGSTVEYRDCCGMKMHAKHEQSKNHIKQA